MQYTSSMQCHDGIRFVAHELDAMSLRFKARASQSTCVPNLISFLFRQCLSCKCLWCQGFTDVAEQLKQESMIATGKAAALLASNRWQYADPAAQEAFSTVAEHLKSV